MTLTRRKLILASTAFGPALWHGPDAAAQDAYPSKPIRLIAPFAAGGTTDLLARMVGAELAKQLGQPVVIENISGASGTIATARLARMPADGYSLGIISGSTLVTGPLTYKDVGYDPLRSLTLIARLAEVTLLLVVRADSPYRSLEDLLAAARAQRQPFIYGTYGVASSGHLAGELLAKRAQVALLPVQYRGGGPLMAAVLGGEVAAVFIPIDTPMPHLRSGAARALATTGRTRHRLLPDVPSIAEVVPGFDSFSVWAGIAAPAGLPAALQQRLAAEARKALAVPEVSERLGALAMDVSFGGPEEMARVVASDIALWGPLIKASGIRAE
ncbi:MAG: Bug family tripartite tricarboxylate transporter substrate binding protein [Burkholderiaceae bacterium]